MEPHTSTTTPPEDGARSVLKDRIEARLREVGISQFVAAERAGKHSHFIYDFMVGRKVAFKGDGLLRLACVLGCSIDYLIGKADEPGQPPRPADAFSGEGAANG